MVIVVHPGQLRNTFPLFVSGHKPAFNFQCLRPQSSVDNHLPIPGNYRGNTSPTRSRLQVKQWHARTRIHTHSLKMLTFVHWVCLTDLLLSWQNQHSLDSRPSSVSSMSSASWANTAAAGSTPLPGILNPSGRRGKLIYTPMLLMDETTSTTQPVWTDGSASLPVGSRPGWYPGQTRTFTSVRMPPVNQGFVDKGSADSLVESVSNDAAGDLCKQETFSDQQQVQLISIYTVIHWTTFFPAYLCPYDNVTWEICLSKCEIHNLNNFTCKFDIISQAMALFTC